MEQELLKVLKEAVAARQRKETLERAIGKAVRKNDLDFSVYVKIMSELRELANRQHKDPEAIARLLVSEGKQG